MTAIASNPALLAMGTMTLLLLGWQFVPAKRRNDPSRLILYGFGAWWLFVLFYETTEGHTRQTLLPFVLATCAVVATLLSWKMRNEWARHKYGGTKIVFDDPFGDAGSGVAPPPPAAAAGWFADTTSRHQLRYWDGSQWTENVSDNGATAVDPVT